jgi:hypothetical protein
MTTLTLTAVAALIYLVWAHNRLVTYRNRVRNAWAQIDVQLRRRGELVPNLVACVRDTLPTRAGLSTRSSRSGDRSAPPETTSRPAARLRTISRDRCRRFCPPPRRSLNSKQASIFSRSRRSCPQPRIALPSRGSTTMTASCNTTPCFQLFPPIWSRTCFYSALLRCSLHATRPSTLAVNRHAERPTNACVVGTVQSLLLADIVAKVAEEIELIGGSISRCLLSEVLYLGD